MRSLRCARERREDLVAHVTRLRSVREARADREQSGSLLLGK
jgi:hypothetical protein